MDGNRVQFSVGRLLGSIGLFAVAMFIVRSTVQATANELRVAVAVIATVMLAYGGIANLYRGRPPWDVIALALGTCIVAFYVLNLLSLEGWRLGAG